MQLTVPHRTVADTGSFPVNPEGVAHWLAALNPLDSEADARKVYSGLKHSNRLHNDVDRRRSVISCFIPVLRDLHRLLNELSDAQPLPLTREFSRHARLRDSLLREEAFAFKILLSDSKKPLADDARRAMQALARQAEAVVHGFRVFPDALIEDAHQLYALAEEHKLLSSQQGSELLSLQDHYRFILLLSVADLSQQRARQLPLVLDFLRGAVADIHIERQRPPRTTGNSDFAIDLKQGSRPEPAASVLSPNQNDVRWFSVAPVLYRINQMSSTIDIASDASPGKDILERQSLARLHVAMARSRRRRIARQITEQPKRVVLGHKEICAYLLHRPTEVPADHESSWVITNETLHGVRLHNHACRAGLVQVGELISVTDCNKALLSPQTSHSNKIDALMGVIRWIRATGSEGISIGVEFLARTVLPVHVTRNTAHETDSEAWQPVVGEISENAVIIACKFQNTVLQTILLPPYLYQVGDKLVVAQSGRTRNVQLHKCLQSNGLFSQYSLVDAA